MTPLERAWRGGKNDWRLHILSVFSVSVAFVCLASALLVVVNVQNLRDTWARSGRATVFLRNGAKSADVEALQRALGAHAAVEDVRLVTSEMAQSELVQGSADSVLARLPAEAFPASLEIQLGQDVSDSELVSLKGSLGALPAVDNIETYDAWTKRLATVLSSGVLASGILAVVVLGAVMSVVASTIRLTLQRRSIEVEVLRLVGATTSYVRRPYVIEGAAQGAIGALVATVLLGLLYWVVTHGVAGSFALLLGTSLSFLPWQWVLGMVGLGAGMGALAAHASLRRLSGV